MGKKEKKSSEPGFRKSLTQKTHPIPPRRVEPDKTKYDRRQEQKEIRKHLEELGKP